jgi:Ca2+/Na+ antiporter
MDRQKLFEYYEKIYFHELNVREKLAGRVQITFALVATAYTILSYMLRMLDYNSSINIIILFSCFCVFFALFSFLSLNNLVRAFWGNEYKGIPSPCETDNYKEQLENHKSAIEQYNNDNPTNTQPTVDVDSKLSGYLYDYYRNCSTHNTEINDRRSVQIHQAFKWLLISIAPLFLASSIFIAMDLDLSSIRKKVNDNQQLLVLELKEVKSKIDKLEQFQINIQKEVFMSDEIENNQNSTPPPPTQPEAPAPRVLIEDIVTNKIIAENNND